MMICRKLFLLVSMMLIVFIFGCDSSQDKFDKFIQKGDAFFQQGNYSKAVLEYRNAVTINPDRVDIIVKIGLAQLKQGKVQEAYAFFMKAVEMQPGHVEANLQLGRLLLGAREYAKAGERVEAVLSKEPNNTQALLLRGGLLLGQKKAGETKKLLEPLLQGGGKEVDLYLLLFAANMQLSDQAAAESVLKQGTAEHPASIPLLLSLANLYLSRQQSGQVEEVLKQIIAIEPDKMEHVERYAAFLWQVGRKDEVQPLLRNLLEKDSAGEERWAAIAAFYLGRQAIDQGQQVLTEGLQRFTKSFRLRLMMKDAYLARGDFGKAMAVLQECMKLDEDDPGYVAAQRGLAELYLRTGDIVQADTYIDGALKKSPNDMEAHLLRAATLVLKGDLDSAIAEYRTVLQARPKDVPTYTRLAEALVRNRQINLAVDTLKQGLQVSPEATELHRALVQVYMLEKKKKEAEEQLKKMIELRPEDVGPQGALADFYAAVGNQAKAVEAYRAIIAKMPDNPLGYIKLSTLYAGDKKVDEAIAAVNAGLAALPEAPMLFEHAVRLYLQLGRMEEALALTGKRLRERPDDVLALTLQGEIHVLKKEYDAAEKEFRKAMELKGDVPELGGRLARVLMLAGRAEGAIRESEQAVAASGGSIGQWIMLADLYRQVNRPDEANGVYERALRQHPGSWFLLNNIAYELGNKEGATPQELARAEELVRQAQQLVPGNPAVLDTAGWLAYKTGKLTQAQTWLSMALASNPNNPVFNHHLAMVLLKNGKKEDARTLFEKVVQAPGKIPEQEEAGRMLQQMAM